MLKTIIDGGYMMVPLMICSVIAAAVVFDRAFAFYRYGKIDTRSLRAQVMRLVRENRLQEAALLCAQTPGPVSAVLLAGIQALAKFQGTFESRELAGVVRTAMDEFTAHAVSAVEKRFGALSTIGNAAPLIGMLGTVVGLIDSFEQLMLHGTEPKYVAGGISVALITTAAGLDIALLAVIPYHFFVGKTNAIDLEMEECKAQFSDYIVAGI